MIIPWHGGKRAKRGPESGDFPGKPRKPGPPIPPDPRMTKAALEFSGFFQFWLEVEAVEEKPKKAKTSTPPPTGFNQALLRGGRVRPGCSFSSFLPFGQD